MTVVNQATTRAVGTEDPSGLGWVILISQVLGRCDYVCTINQNPMMMKKRAFPGMVALGSLLLAGCYPDQPDYIDEYDITYTNYSPSFDFKAANTYSLPDSVVIISGDLAEGEQPSMVDPLYGDQILGRIRDNMNSLGWTEVENAVEADVVVLPSAIKTLNIDTYYYGGYWGWYYPYYGYGYGWYYPGYYPTYTSYTTGSLLVQMNVPSDLSPTESIPVVWIAIFNGLLEGSDASINSRVVNGIDQAFEQSPYLQQ